MKSGHLGPYGGALNQKPQGRVSQRLVLRGSLFIIPSTEIAA